MWNQAFFRTIRVQDGRIADSTHEEPFASLLGSQKGSMVDSGDSNPDLLAASQSRVNGVLTWISAGRE
jgi:hypothetical protein